MGLFALLALVALATATVTKVTEANADVLKVRRFLFVVSFSAVPRPLAPSRASCCCVSSGDRVRVKRL